MDLTGNANLVEGAKKSGVKKFVLLTSLLTNAKAVGQSDNPNYKFLNLFGGGKPRTPICGETGRAKPITWDSARRVTTGAVTGCHTLRRRATLDCISIESAVFVSLAQHASHHC